MHGHAQANVTRRGVGGGGVAHPVGLHDHGAAQGRAGIGKAQQQAVALALQHLPTERGHHRARDAGQEMANALDHAAFVGLDQANRIDNVRKHDGRPV